MTAVINVGRHAVVMNASSHASRTSGGMYVVSTSLMRGDVGQTIDLGGVPGGAPEMGRNVRMTPLGCGLSRNGPRSYR